MLSTSRPYPDELLHSAVVRYCRHFGIPFKRLGTMLLGRRSWRPGFLLPMPLSRIATLFHATPEELLWQHTAFPYATAYLPAASYECALTTALRGDEGNPRLAATIQNATSGLAFLRFCPRCKKLEMDRHGESYWHVSHNLPGALACALHRTILFESGIPGKDVTTTSYCLPHEVQGTALRAGRPSAAMLRVVDLAAGLQRRPAGPSVPRDGAYYRWLAITNSWLDSGRPVRQQKLAKAMQRHFPAQLLRLSGLDPSNLDWAALMLRPRVGTPHTTAKHVLLQEALCSPAPHRTRLEHRPSGPPRTAPAALDAFYSAQAREQLRVACSGREQLTTEAFLRRAACWQTYRHRKAEMPLLRQVVLQFRASTASVKPLRRGSVLFRTMAAEVIR